MIFDKGFNQNEPQKQHQIKLSIILCINQFLVSSPMSQHSDTQRDLSKLKDRQKQKQDDLQAKGQQREKIDQNMQRARIKKEANQQMNQPSQHNQRAEDCYQYYEPNQINKDSEYSKKRKRQIGQNSEIGREREVKIQEHQQGQFLSKDILELQKQQKQIWTEIKSIIKDCKIVEKEKELSQMIFNGRSEQLIKNNKVPNVRKKPFKQRVEQIQLRINKFRYDNQEVMTKIAEQFGIKTQEQVKQIIELILERNFEQIKRHFAPIQQQNFLKRIWPNQIYKNKKSKPCQEEQKPQKQIDDQKQRNQNIYISDFTPKQPSKQRGQPQQPMTEEQQILALANIKEEYQYFYGILNIILKLNVKDEKKYQLILSLFTDKYDQQKFSVIIGKLRKDKIKEFHQLDQSIKLKVLIQLKQNQQRFKQKMQQNKISYSRNWNQCIEFLISQLTEKQIFQKENNLNKQIKEAGFQNIKELRIKQAEIQEDQPQTFQKLRRISKDVININKKKRQLKQKGLLPQYSGIQILKIEEKLKQLENSCQYGTNDLQSYFVDKIKQLYCKYQYRQIASSKNKKMHSEQQKKQQKNEKVHFGGNEDQINRQSGNYYPNSTSQPSSGIFPNYPEQNKVLIPSQPISQYSSIPFQNPSLRNHYDDTKLNVGFKRQINNTQMQIQEESQQSYNKLQILDKYCKLDDKQQYSLLFIFISPRKISNIEIEIYFNNSKYRFNENQFNIYSQFTYDKKNYCLIKLDLKNLSYNQYQLSWQEHQRQTGRMNAVKKAVINYVLGDNTEILYQKKSFYFGNGEKKHLKVISQDQILDNQINFGILFSLMMVCSQVLSIKPSKPILNRINEHFGTICCFFKLFANQFKPQAVKAMKNKFSFRNNNKLRGPEGLAPKISKSFVKNPKLLKMSQFQHIQCKFMLKLSGRFIQKNNCIQRIKLRFFQIFFKNFVASSHSDIFTMQV